MKKILFSLILFACSCSEQQIKYKDFLALRDAYNDGLSLKESSKFKEAIDKFLIADRSIENFPASYQMAECYQSLNKKKDATEMLRISFARGFPIERIDKEKFKDIWSEVENAYAIESTRYYERVDTILKKELDSMVTSDQVVRYSKTALNVSANVIDSLNILRLREICDRHGWPGRKILGYGPIPDPSILVIHASESDNLYFLKLAIDASVNNEASWFGARAIMINLLWRFEQNGYNKLRHTFLTSKCELDLEESSFQLMSLAKFLSDNPHKTIELVAFEQPGKSSFNKCYYDILVEIRQTLSEYGVDNNDVSLSPTLMPKSSDEFQEYFFGVAFKSR